MKIPLGSAIAVSFAALTSCHAPVDAPQDAYPFAPPVEYRAAWAKVQQCSGRGGQLARIRWYAVRDSAIPCPGGACSGVWYPPHSIYLAEASVHDSVSGYFVVRHEMLHDLLQVAHHPEPFCKCGLWGAERGMGSC